MNNQPQISIVVPKKDPDYYQYAILEGFLHIYGIKSTTVLENEFKGTNNDLVVYLGNGNLFNTQKDEYHEYAIHIGHFSSKAWIYCDSKWVGSRKDFLTNYKKLCSQLKDKAETICPNLNDSGCNATKWYFRITGLLVSPLVFGILYDRHKSFRENLKSTKKLFWDNDFVPMKYHYMLGLMWFILNCLDRFLKQNGFEKIAETKDIKADTKETKSENVN